MTQSLTKALAKAISLAVISVSAAAADPQTNTNPYDMNNMGKCQVTKNGTGMIKAHKSDCKAADGKSSCAGQNAAGQTNAWIFVPKGQCEKINMGDCSGISADARSRLENGVCK